MEGVIDIGTRRELFVDRHLKTAVDEWSMYAAERYGWDDNCLRRLSVRSHVHFCSGDEPRCAWEHRAIEPSIRSPLDNILSQDGPFVSE